MFTRRKTRILVLWAFTTVASIAGTAKESKDVPRPKRGSIELGKGSGAQTNPGKVDELNNLFVKVVETVVPSVVSIVTEKKWTEQMQPLNNPLYEFFGMPQPQGPQNNSPKRNIPLGGGSGFIVAKEGYIFTNAHVVDGADIIKVGLNNKKTYVAKVMGIDKKADVAVLKIDAPESDLKPVDFGDSQKLKIGEWVLAVGNPFALQNTVTTGIISAISRREQMAGTDSYQDFIQTDAAVNPGNSGGPLVNLRGEVIGINSSIYTRTGGYMGVSFAIPINMAVKIIEDLIFEGKVTRGYLGIGIDNVDDNLAGAFGLPNSQGCLVREIMPSSPAAKSGLKSGDIILKVGDTPIQDASHLRNFVADLKPGNHYPFDIWRDGKKSTLSVKIGAKPDDNSQGGDTEEISSDGEELSGGFVSRALGFRFGALDEPTRNRYGIDPTVSGVIILQVIDGSSAAENGIVEGMVLTHYKRKQDQSFQVIKQPKGLSEAMKALKKGESIAFKVSLKGKTDLKALRVEE